MTGEGSETNIHARGKVADVSLPAGVFPPKNLPAGRGFSMTGRDAPKDLFLRAEKGLAGGPVTVILGFFIPDNLDN